jgi:hypothetical protein
MNTPSLAQMRLALNKGSNPDRMDNIGINEALDMNPKVFMNPNPNSPGIPDVGGVKTSSGLPIGGVDVNAQQAGQQFMPQQPQQQQQQASQPQQPSGPTPPMGNMLQMTPQGQALGAMGGNTQQTMQNMAHGGLAKMHSEIAAHYAKGGKADPKGVAKDDDDEEAVANPKRILIKAEGHGGVHGINLPLHMLEGNSGIYKSGANKGKTFRNEGLHGINEARAAVYGSENREPLSLSEMRDIHEETLKNHFALPLKEQKAAEKIALAKLRAAKHLKPNADTLDKSEKLDTVHHEYDDQGRNYVAYGSKGVAGHAIYISGHGPNRKYHVINTCPGSTTGCSGGVDKNGIVDTRKGTCFAPNAEAQYVGASVRRAAHEQAKFDPAMTRDWILAHTGSLRNKSETADKKNKVTLFRPNIVDETDTTSRYAIKHLNKQRAEKGLPKIISNSYGKTNELHDPENGIFITHSNVGPKVKHGKEIEENISRDNARVRNTIRAVDSEAKNAKDFTNEEGNLTPPKNSYMVTNVKRDTPEDKRMQEAITHAKYWSRAKPISRLTPEELAEGHEGHYDAHGNPTTPENAHYGHKIFEGERYDYQKQHILHSRKVQVGVNNDGTPHMIPTDSRFKDEEFLPKKRFMTKNGKVAGAILMTTPTTSTSNEGHNTSFTHDVGEHHIKHALENNGEYEIDDPLQQFLARGNKFAEDKPIKIVRKAGGGHINGDPMTECFRAFPEQNNMAQMIHAKKSSLMDIHHLPKDVAYKGLRRNG